MSSSTLPTNEEDVGLPTKTGLESETNKVLESHERFTPLQRNLYLSLVALAGLMAPMASTIFFPALIQMKADFKTTDSMMDITVSVFIFILAIAPLVWGGASDLYGRKWVYVISQFIFCLSCIGCALSPDVETFIVMRVFQGIGSSAPLVVGIGTISDIYPRSERGIALGLFFVGPLIGPVIGPIIGGFMAKSVGWRAIFWLMAGLSGLIFLVVLFLLKETLSPDRRQKFPIGVDFKPFKIRTTGKTFNPLAPLYYLKFPAVLMGSLYGTLIFSAYYAASISQTRAMTVFYQLDASSIGLTYIAMGIGNIVGSVTGGKASDLLLNRYSKKHGSAPPEVRLHAGWVGIASIITGLMMDGWFIQSRFPLPAVLFSQFLIGAGMTNVFSIISTYLVDLYPSFGASITAVANGTRMIGAGIIISVNSIILNKLDFGWAFTMFGLLQLIGVACHITLVFFGAKIRGHPSK